MVSVLDAFQQERLIVFINKRIDRQPVFNNMVKLSCCFF